MGLFSRTKILTEQQIAQLFDVWAWLLGAFDGYKDFLETELVQPSDEHFPIDELDDEELPGDVFDRVRAFAGLTAWECELIAQEEQRRSFMQADFIEQSWGSDDPQGTFLLDDAVEDDKPRAIITYAPDLVQQPENLVATLAHELAHYLLTTAELEPPGGPGALEPATDVASVFLGFGIFGANAAFQFEQFQGASESGWQYRSAGYLSQAEWAYALAIFLRLRDLPPADALEWLDDNPKGYLKKALADLKRREAELQRLRDTHHNRDAGPRALLTRELERFSRGAGRLADHQPATALGNRLLARYLLRQETTDLYGELAKLRRRGRAPTEPLEGLEHWCSLAAATVLLREERPEEARRGAKLFDAMDELTAPGDLPAEALELGLALHALAGHDDRAEALRSRRLELPLEEGYAIVGHELLYLSAGRPSGATDPLVWSAVRGWLADLERTGGETGLALVCLLAARIDQTGLALADRLRSRLPLWESHCVEEKKGRARRRFVWQPLGLGLSDAEGTPGLDLLVGISGKGRLDGAITSAAPITTHLQPTLANIEESLVDSARRSPDNHSEVDPALDLELSRRLKDAKIPLHVQLHTPEGLQLEPTDLAMLQERFDLAMEHQARLRKGFCRPGCLIHVPDSPRAD